MNYAIPLEGAKHLQIGTWVEVLEACGNSQSEEPIRVHVMRVRSQVLVFGKKCSRRLGLTPLHPHEGRVESLEPGPKEIRFRLRMSS